jgi:threonine/homoserine/homoserine lactone efflux protein
VIVRNHLKIFGSAFATGFTGAVAPGPLLFVCAYNALTAGFLAGMMTVAGHALAELILVVVLSAGLAGFLTSRPAALRVVKIVAGLVLVALGVMMLLYVPTAEFRTGSAGASGTTLAQPILMGAAVSVGNPYFIVWWATVGLGLLGGASLHGRAGVVTFYVGHQLSDVVWYAFVAGSIALGRTAVLGPTSYRVLLAASGLFMIGFGIYFAVAGRRTLPERV